MLIREVSDLHSEFWYDLDVSYMLNNHVLPPLPTDKDTVLLLPGDIGVFYRYTDTIGSVLAATAARFRHVLYGYGNHEYYNSCVWGAERRFWKDKVLPKNVTVLQDGYKIIDGVVFIGATLWTSLHDANERAVEAARRNMNDYRLIKAGRYHPDADAYMIRMMAPVTPHHTMESHHESVRYIFDTCRRFRAKKRKVVVMTHHLPSLLSVHPQYAGSPLNPAFYSELAPEIEKDGPDFWFHGHTHNSFAYDLRSTRVICNPYGYHDTWDQNGTYDPTLLLEI